MRRRILKACVVLSILAGLSSCETDSVIEPSSTTSTDNTKSYIQGFEENGKEFKSGEVYVFSVRDDLSASYKWTIHNGTIVQNQGSSVIMVKMASVENSPGYFYISVKKDGFEKVNTYWGSIKPSIQ